MNYIKEINAFYDRQEWQPLSANAVALWSALMHINNKTRWKNTFTTAGAVLQYKAGLSESGFKRARKELADLGYIEVKPRGSHKAPIYTMHSLVMEPVEREGVDEQDEGEQSSAEQPNSSGNDEPEKPVHSLVDHSLNLTSDRMLNPSPNSTSAPLIKQYKSKTNTKQNNRHTAAAAVRTVIFDNEEKEQEAGRKEEVENSNVNVVKFYQENFGVVRPFVEESILDWTSSLGEELVMEAMKRALSRNISTWAYVKSILNAWYKKGIRTLADAEAELVVFQNKHKLEYRGTGASVSGRADIVPDWFEDHMEERKRRAEERERASVQGERGRVRELLEQYSGVGVSGE